MKRLLASSFVFLALAGGAPAHAVFIGNAQGGTDFPQGAISFADTVVSFAPGTGGLTTPHLGTFNALGIPDYAGVTDCPSQAACPYVSLGSGGSIVLRFDDNRLTGSGDSSPDLWIFEVGPDVEDTFVDISTNGSDWHAVGKVLGSTRGVDLDHYGFGPDAQFTYVRLTDDPHEGSTSGVTVGADIDAVGAISTVPVPEPGTWAMLLVGLGLLGVMGRRGQRTAG